ncbi:lpha-methylacylracemase [Diaporthe amygdali]|uniref:lpha-methylacylracemase n=1 Tax=Phomopsis amygdali TaxID=1214568 RepID=UPI0022FF3116|nr:lpha-methylacylracemase [Diaporthe amygdali]KAJ0114954.1 lpha-methylacylracemase [Diaporthe amygdali]
MANPPPLTGLKVLEFAGLAPGPFAGLLLADAGASVIRVDRPSTSPTADHLTRHKASVAVDLSTPAGRAVATRLARAADVLIEPFRPGVMERLGLGPDELCAANPALVYARMTGFRRDGRYAAMAGHDINYLAVGGVLGMLGPAGGRPAPPVNILGDFAGGGAVLVQGVLMALLARARTGRGQVVEANMVDGAGYLATFPRFARKTPMGDGPRGTNVLDGGCPYYDTYETRDGRYVAVGALEPQFYAALVKGLGLEGQGWEQRRLDRDCWPEMRATFETIFGSRTRDEWEAVFDGTDACCTPVFDYAELEGAGEGREGDQRPIVTLRETPCLAVDSGPRPSTADAVSRGQGPGVPGNGYVGKALVPGENGETALRDWLGWEKGKQYDVENDGLVLRTGSKL